jgi:glutamyl-tRNA reductase
MSLITVVGISHARTPAHLRERLQLTPDEAAEYLDPSPATQAKPSYWRPATGTEIYLASADVADGREQARLAFVKHGGTTLLRWSIYTYDDEAAAGHLFRVAAGLESTVLGDTDVAAQVRRASAAARATGTAGPLLDRLFAAASTASKRVRSETSVSTGATSIPAAAIAIAAEVAAPLHQRRLLVVGAGEMATKAALHAHGAAAARSSSRTGQLPERGS